MSTPNHESLQAPPALSAEVGHRAATRGRVSRDVLEAHWPLWQGSRWSQIPPSHHRGLRREDRRTELRFLSGAQAPFSEGLASFSKYDLPILLCLFLLLSLTLRCLFPSALGLFRRSLPAGDGDNPVDRSSPQPGPSTHTGRAQAPRALTRPCQRAPIYRWPGSLAIAAEPLRQGEGVREEKEP